MRAGTQRRHDARDGVVLGGRGQHDEGLAAVRAVRRAHKVGLPAGAGIGREAQAFRAALAHEVDLHRRVDGVQVVVLARQIRVVGEIDRVHFQPRVAVQEVIQLFRTQRERRHHLARQVIFLAVGHHAGFDQRHDAVANHLGVHAQVVLVRQLHHHRIRNAAVADLQRRAVRDHVSDVLADGFLHRADFWQPDFHQRLVAFRQRGDLRDMDVAVAVGKRHVRIDLQHHGAGVFQRGHRVIGRQREREKAMLVHRRGHGKHHVRGNQPTRQQSRKF